MDEPDDDTPDDADVPEPDGDGGNELWDVRWALTTPVPVSGIG